MKAMKLGVINHSQLNKFAGMISDDAARLVLEHPGGVYIAATVDGVSAGLIAAVCDTCEVRIISLFVAPGFRYMGVGRQLVYSLALGNLEGSVSCNTIPEDMREFFIKLGFLITPRSGGIFHVTLDQISTNSFFKQCAADDIMPFSAVDSHEISRFAKRYKALMRNEVCPFPMKSADKHISHVLAYDGLVVGAGVFVNGKDYSELAWLYCEKEFSHNLQGILIKMFNAACEKLPPSKKIYINAITESSRRIVQTLCPGATFTQVYEGNVRQERLIVSAQAHSYKDAAIKNTAPSWFNFNKS